jgi:hypothetical protein
METKVLLRLIRDDIRLLDEIANSLINDPDLSKEEIDVALSRARGIVTEFEMLSKKLSLVSKPVGKVSIEVVRPEEEKVIKEKVKTEEESSLIDIEEDSTQTNVIYPSATKKPDVSVVIPKTEPLKSPDPIKTDVKVTKPLTEEIHPKSQETVKSKKVDLSEDTSQKTIGESMGDGHQMVNDLLASDKYDHLFEGKPLKSMREGIGLNDRFLFIRELFSGDSDQYNKTIETLDSFSTIKEAVEYLKLNFKWSKSDAGEKFLHLVKRRYKL